MLVCCGKVCVCVFRHLSSFHLRRLVLHVRASIWRNVSEHNELGEGGGASRRPAAIAIIFIITIISELGEKLETEGECVPKRETPRQHHSQPLAFLPLLPWQRERTGRSAGRVVGWCDRRGVGVVHCHLKVRGRPACGSRPPAAARLFPVPKQGATASPPVALARRTRAPQRWLSYSFLPRPFRRPPEPQVDVWNRKDGPGSRRQEPKHRSLRNPGRASTRHHAARLHTCRASSFGPADPKCFPLIPHRSAGPVTSGESTSYCTFATETKSLLGPAGALLQLRPLAVIT